MTFGSHRGVSDEKLFEIENVVMKPIRGLKGLKPKLRIARLYYGYGVSKRFVKGVYEEWQSFFEPYYNKEYCYGTVSWKIKNGQSIDAKTKAPFNIHTTICDTDRVYHTTLSLYCCIYEESPLYGDDWKTERVGEVKLYFTDAEIDASPRKYNKKKKQWYRNVNYTLEIDLAAD
ncbi:Heat shock protein HSP72 [Lasiodiplodia theobromae]|uniref:Heat shock protein HSP72 n=1 Tax=Lasiodiplodia theobromae TaxID=45133 RepID=UPI0015C326D3|nr:Heat shock protein HSP72 [Lasiodiplodia theobromae]KAF4537851.1 Heat shock protein HSP72 [Lasiodiplodia theobromae]